MTTDERKTWAADARMRFENRYERLPSWEVGRPQPVFVELEERGLIGRRVLDAGCGTGETALYLAAKGYSVWGVDIAPTAIGIARANAQARDLPAARFLVGDALSMESMALRFDTVIDSGLLHALSDAQREVYIHSVATVLEPDGWFHVLGFSEKEPGTDGPRRLSRAELEDAFREWQVVELVDARFQTNNHKNGAEAYRVSARLVYRFHDG